jgi:hypothetical protein
LLSPREIDVLHEVARQANWDAIHGPAWMKAGRFRAPTDESPSRQAPNGDAPTSKNAQGSRTR